MLTPTGPRRRRLTLRQHASVELQILNFFEDVLATMGVSCFTMMDLWVEPMRRNGLSANEVRWVPNACSTFFGENVRSCACACCPFAVHGDTHAGYTLECLAPTK